MYRKMLFFTLLFLGHWCTASEVRRPVVDFELSVNINTDIQNKIVNTAYPVFLDYSKNWRGIIGKSARFIIREDGDIWIVHYAIEDIDYGYYPKLKGFIYQRTHVLNIKKNSYEIVLPVTTIPAHTELNVELSLNQWLEFVEKALPQLPDSGDYVRHNNIAIYIERMTFHPDIYQISISSCVVHGLHGMANLCSDELQEICRQGEKNEDYTLDEMKSRIGLQPPTPEYVEKIKKYKEAGHKFRELFRRLDFREPLIIISGSPPAGAYIDSKTGNFIGLSPPHHEKSAPAF